MTKEFSTTIVRRKEKGVKAFLPFEFDANGDNSAGIPAKIHLIPIGQWEHDSYGPIRIMASDIREFLQNFNAGIRKGVFITAGHEGFNELPACGWVKEVEQRDTGLWGTIDWTDLGKETLSDKQFKFFSPEMYTDFYEDPETHNIYRNVLTGGALTKSPYFKELEAVVFSEPKKIINKKFNTMTKTLEEVLAIQDVSTLTDEEKALVKENEATLTDEQKAKFLPPAETVEEKTAREEKEKGDANEAAGLNRDGSEKKIEGSEKKMVQISASELAHLTKKADEGAEAFRELEKGRLDIVVKALVFNAESNKTGKFLPKSEANIRAFMESLNLAQKLKFSALLGELPTKQIFGEAGHKGETGEGTVKADVEAKVAEKMKANDKLKYSDALKQVFSENKGLEKSYDMELVPVRESKNQ